jgi:hypothetical protein
MTTVIEPGQCWRNYRSGRHVRVVRIDVFSNVTRVVFQHETGKRSSELIELFPAYFQFTAPAKEGPDHYP